MITLATLHKATTQEVFDQVATHLLTQNRRSEDNISGDCLYRSGSLKCAAGCLIADSEYEDSMENESWFQLCITYGITKTHSLLIQKLQQLHDKHSPAYWKCELENLAKGSGLNTDCIKLLPLKTQPCTQM